MNSSPACGGLTVFESDIGQAAAAIHVVAHQASGHPHFCVSFHETGVGANLAIHKVDASTAAIHVAGINDLTRSILVDLAFSTRQ